MQYKVELQTTGRASVFDRSRALTAPAARLRKMVEQMDAEGFGNCTNYYECEVACPKEISVQHIARMNREYLRAAAVSAER